MGLLKNWRFWLLAFFLVASVSIVAFRGIDFGIDFKGGTLFTIEFSEKVVNPEDKAKIARTVSQRLDWTGLRDTTVTFFGSEFVLAQLAETDPAAIARIESLLQKQGRFEATIDGNVIFTGEGIIAIIRDASRGYGFRKEGDAVRWYLPFTLRTAAAERFKDLTFHRCTLVSFSQEQGRAYECDKTYFFIDRPLDAVLVIPEELYNSDRQLLLAGNSKQGISQELKIEEVLVNGQTPYIKVSSKEFSELQLSELREIKKTKKVALIPEGFDDSLKVKLEEIGFEARAVQSTEGIAWVWNALGLKEVISLSEDVAQMDAATKEEAKIMSDLQITGIAPDFETAQQRLSDLDILLSSGSLVVSVKSISKESISPLLGENFLVTVLWMGAVAVIVVSLVVFVRYRKPKLTGLLVFMIFGETLITIALSSLISKFDLGAVAGIIAAVGTGIDTEIIITDELLRGKAGEEAISLFSRAKRALFVIFAAASVSLATMLPIIFFGYGLGKLVGFAITTSIGVLVGIIITRPAFAELARMVLEKTSP